MGAQFNDEIDPTPAGYTEGRRYPSASQSPLPKIHALNLAFPTQHT